MKILNLVYPDKSDIQYRIDRFPDGQQQIVIDLEKSKFTNEIAAYYKNCKIEIKSRLNNFQDLELIVCAVKSLRNLGVKEIHLYVPYFLGSRSDRQFEEGSNNYLKDVICPIINSLNFESVTVLDPHSDVLEACLNGFKKVSNLELIKNSLFNIQTGIYPGMLNKPEYLDKFILVSPDAGASKKIYKIAEQIGYNGDIITCSKDRDANGKLTKCIVPFGPYDYAGKDFIIIDDICDGGNTFINIAKSIIDKRDNPMIKPKIYLVVTHGIFSKGFTELSQYFDGIYCTNSYSDIEKQFEPFKEINGYSKNFVKQLNVFNE